MKMPNTKSDCENLIAVLEREKIIFEKQQQIRELRHEIRRGPRPTKTTLLIIFLFLNFTVVEIFSMVAMWHFGNLDALYVLITTVLAEPITFAVYAAKAYAGKKQEELIRLERDRLDIDEEVVG